MPPIHLNGIPGGHGRGITPLLTIGHRYAELHPDLGVSWNKRRLQAFADQSPEELSFAYLYSHYALEGFSQHLLEHTSLLTLNGVLFRTTIGGTDISVSVGRKHREDALGFAVMIVSGVCQRTVYLQRSGQPACRSAWTDDAANRLTNGFFRSLLPVMDTGNHGPRYDGYLHFQDHAGLPFEDCLMREDDPGMVLKYINGIHRLSLSK
jgi:multiple sugar transport system substrate-binding protein